MPRDRSLNIIQNSWHCCLPHPITILVSQQSHSKSGHCFVFPPSAFIYHLGNVEEDGDLNEVYGEKISLSLFQGPFTVGSAWSLLLPLGSHPVLRCLCLLSPAVSTGPVGITTAVHHCSLTTQTWWTVPLMAQVTWSVLSPAKEGLFFKPAVGSISDPFRWVGSTWSLRPRPWGRKLFKLFSMAGLEKGSKEEPVGTLISKGKQDERVCAALIN